MLINLCADCGMHSKFQPVLTQLSLSQVFSGLPCAFVVSMQPEMCGELISAFLQLSYLQDLPVKFMAYLLLGQSQDNIRGRTVGVLDPFPTGSALLSQQSCRFLPKYHCKYRRPSLAQQLLVNTANPERLTLMFLSTELWWERGVGTMMAASQDKKATDSCLLPYALAIFFNINFS